MSERTTARLRYSAVALAVFFTAYNLRLLLFRWEAFDTFYRAYPWQVGETVWKTLWVVLAVAGAMMAHRIRPREALREVGLACAPGRALALAFLAAAPMFLAFALFSGVNPCMELLYLWMTAVVSPISEEVLFRGYLFRQLYERARWPLWAAVLMNVVPFAWGHLNQADRAGMDLGGFAMVFLITGAGAALFAWLFVRWNYNLWFVIGLHGLMNLWWYVFAVDDTAVGDTVANVARLLTAGAAVLLTLNGDRLFRSGQLALGMMAP